jgi:hypothetical protein
MGSRPRGPAAVIGLDAAIKDDFRFEKADIF